MRKKTRFCFQKFHWGENEVERGTNNRTATPGCSSLRNSAAHRSTVHKNRKLNFWLRNFILVSKCSKWLADAKYGVPRNFSYQKCRKNAVRTSFATSKMGQNQRAVIYESRGRENLNVWHTWGFVGVATEFRGNPQIVRVMRKFKNV